MADQGLEGSNPVDLSKHPYGIVPTLQNIVSTVNLDCKLDLKAIALQARNAEYNPKYARIVQKLGFPAKFKVGCKELFYRDLPTLDDFLADKLLPGCTTLKEVEETLTKRCQEMEQEAKEQATDNAILEQIRKMVEVRFLDLYLRNKEDSFMELGF